MSAININNQWFEPEDLLTNHERVLEDLRTEVEQLQTAHADAAMGGIASALEPTIERYARVNIKKNAKGEYQHETTVTVTMTGGDWTQLQEELATGLRAADGAARIEIHERIGWDQHPFESDDGSNDTSAF